MEINQSGARNLNWGIANESAEKNREDHADAGTRDTELSDDKDNFDGEGFANYLLPYAIALIGSIAATAAVFKFVLLDY